MGTKSNSSVRVFKEDFKRDAVALVTEEFWPQADFVDPKVRSFVDLAAALITDMARQHDHDRS